MSDVILLFIVRFRLPEGSFVKNLICFSFSENSDDHKERVESAMQQIDSTDTYELTKEELIFGARLAWRNTPRCIGRIQYKKLHVSYHSLLFCCYLLIPT